MPGYELIGKEEHKEISELFKKSKTLFRMGFEKNRKGIFKVRDFERAFSQKLKTNYSLGVTSGTAALRVAIATINTKKFFDRYETKTHAWNARQNTLRLVSYNRRANPVKKNGQQVRQL